MITLRVFPNKTRYLQLYSSLGYSDTDQRPVVITQTVLIFKGILSDALHKGDIYAYGC